MVQLFAALRILHQLFFLLQHSGKERGLDSPFAQKEKEKFTKKRKTGCVLVQNVVSYKGVQK